MVSGVVALLCVLSTAAPTESSEAQTVEAKTVADTPAIEAKEHLAEALPLVQPESATDDATRQKKSPNPSAMCMEVKDEKTGLSHLSCENQQVGAASQYAPTYQSYQKPSYGGGKFQE